MTGIHTSIRNRHGLTIKINIDLPKHPIGVAFVIHGLGGHRKQAHIKTFAKSFLDKNYTTITFDTTNSFGESEGAYENATVTSYHHDLHDVIHRAQKQPRYQEPFILCGHSLGALAVSLYAEAHPEKIKALAPISSVISGELTLKTYAPEKTIHRKRTGWFITTSSIGKTKRLKRSHVEDRLQYNLLTKADKLIMPTLLIVGELDESTPPEHQKLLFEKLPGPKEYHLIQGAPHAFKDPKHLEQVADIFHHRLEKLT